MNFEDEINQKVKRVRVRKKFFQLLSLSSVIENRLIWAFNHRILSRDWGLINFSMMLHIVQRILIFVLTQRKKEKDIVIYIVRLRIILTKLMIWLVVKAIYLHNMETNLDIRLLILLNFCFDYEMSLSFSFFFCSFSFNTDYNVYLWYCRILGMSFISPEVPKFI